MDMDRSWMWIGRGCGCGRGPGDDDALAEKFPFLSIRILGRSQLNSLSVSLLLSLLLSKDGPGPRIEDGNGTSDLLITCLVGQCRYSVWMPVQMRLCWKKPVEAVPLEFFRFCYTIVFW